MVEGCNNLPPLLPHMKVILYQAQIPQNTGNIVRTCSCTGISLALVPPLGFSIDDKYLKRAGLDYWEGVDVEIIENLEAYLEASSSPFYFFSSKASRYYSDVNYTEDALLIFGSETSGLPALYWERWKERFLTLPMRRNKRCLNLSSATTAVVYEAMRQLNFEFYS